MNKITNLIQNLERVSNENYLVLAVFEQIKRYENLFVRKQKEQLSKGEDSLGDLFGTYTQATEDIAKTESPRKPKKAGQPYNFEYTGGLFDGMQLIVNKDSALFYSTDSKTPELIAKYDGLFGLQEDNLKEIIQRAILPSLVLELRKQIGV